MIVFLLIIIAIGVLLASEEGKELLGSLFKLAWIGGLVYIAFWIIVFGIALISGVKKETWDVIGTIFGTVSLIFAVGYYLREGWIKRREIRERLIKLPGKLWKEHRFSTIFFTLIYSGILIVFIWAFITEK